MFQSKCSSYLTNAWSVRKGRVRLRNDVEVINWYFNLRFRASDREPSIRAFTEKLIFLDIGWKTVIWSKIYNLIILNDVVYTAAFDSIDNGASVHIETYLFTYRWWYCGSTWWDCCIICYVVHRPGKCVSIQGCHSLTITCSYFQQQFTRKSTETITTSTLLQTCFGTVFW